MWGPAHVSGQGRECYFLLVVDDYTRYTTVFPLRSKGEVPDVLIPWIYAVHLQLRERFRQDLRVMRLHSDRGGEFSSDLFRDFCRGEGILHSFMLPAFPQQNGVAERRIGLVMEVARTSMIHTAAPHFLWLFVVRYAAHQLNLWPHVSLPETSPTLRWTGKFYHPTSRRVLPSQDVTFDESVPFYRLFPYRTAPPPPPPAALPRSRSPSGRPTPPSGSCSLRGAASGGAEAMGEEPGGAEPASAEPGGAEPEGAEPGGAEIEGVEPWGAEYEGAESGGAEPKGTASAGGPTGAGGPAARGIGAGGAGATSPRGARVTAGDGGTGAAGAAGPGGACTRDTGVAGAGGVGGAGAGDLGAGGTGAGGARAGGTGAGDPGAGGSGGGDPGVGDPGAGGARAGGAGAGGIGAGGARAGGVGVGGAGAGGARDGGTGAGGGGAGDPGARGAGTGGAGSGGSAAGGTLQRRPIFVPPCGSVLRQVFSLPSSTALTTRLLCPPPHQSQPQLQPDSSLPAPSPYAEQTKSLTERREPAFRRASPVRDVCTGRRVPRPHPPPVPGTHIMALLRAACPTVTRLLATVVTDPLFESAATSALVAELVDFAAACCLDYAASLVAESKSDCPPSVVGECVLGTDVLEDRQEDFECLAAAVPHLVAMLLAPEGDPDAPDILNPHSYAEAIMGHYSSK
ncbi:unnamed protein product [Closterium sp. NIES-53]